MTNINDLNNKDIYNYYKYLCAFSNKYYNKEEDKNKNRKNYGNLILLKQIYSLINTKNITENELKKIIPIPIKQFNYAFYNEALMINIDDLKKTLYILQKYN